MIALFAALAAVLGLIFGSFATMAAYRIPLRASLNGRSECPACGHTITAAENIPVLSYLRQGGRCRHCGAKISVRYPLIELLTAILFALAALRFGPTLKAAVYSAFFWVLIMLSVIDLEHRLLPDRIIFPALAVGALLLLVDAVSEDTFGRMSGVVVASAAAVAGLLWILLPRRGPDRESGSRPGSWLVGLGFVLAWMGLVGLGIVGGTQRSISGALVGAAVFAGFFLAVTLLMPKGLGGGDVKLGLLLGAFLGYLGAPGLVLVAMFTAFLLGSLVSVVVLLTGGSRKSAIPFGPFLSLGAVASVLVGDQMIDLYLGLGAG
ncbi:MAG: prepilin peptidase [Actinomycetota bacterium]|nr:prepilin peptidase [Actinomycetota bacterium]